MLIRAWRTAELFGGEKAMMQRVLLGAACAAVLAMTGCAHPDFVDLNASADAVTQSLGAPDAVVPLPDGGERFVYSMQPMSQQVWWLSFDPQGRLLSKENVLDREHFALIKPGVSTERDVFSLFGKCAQTYEFALKNEHAWMYRFLDDGMFYMACWVQFNTQGIVTEVGYTTDPWRDRDGSFWAL